MADYVANRIADQSEIRRSLSIRQLRSALVAQRESFIFETVLSDPVGEKVEQLATYTVVGYTVVLIFIQIGSPEESIKRVAMRLSQGGHDVPDEKLRGRFERTLANLNRAIERLPYVIVYSNDDLAHPYKFVELYENGKNTSHFQTEQNSS